MKAVRYLLVSLVAAACFLAPAACQKVGSPIEDYQWVLLRYGEPGNMKTALADAPATAFFDSEAKTVTGSTGCNAYDGQYTVDGLSVSISGPIGVTEMWCGDEQGEQERLFLNALQAAESFEMDHGNLHIRSGNTMLIFKLEGAEKTEITQWGD
jgi:heat shock protein HslJ